MRLGRLLAALLLLAPAGACSMVVDATDIDEGCAPNEKICNDRCVSIDDPAYGCSIDGCTNCAFETAIPICSADHVCIVKTCLEGYCGDRCETNILISEEHCGGCASENACKADEICENGSCVQK